MFFRFANNNIGSPFFKLMNPALRKKMKESNVWFNRAQTEIDTEMRILCNKLKKASLIQEVIVDKEHLTTVVIITETEKLETKVITCKDDILKMYDKPSDVYNQVCKIIGVPIEIEEEGEEDEQVKDIEEEEIL